MTVIERRQPSAVWMALQRRCRRSATLVQQMTSLGDSGVRRQVEPRLKAKH